MKAEFHLFYSDEAITDLISIYRYIEEDLCAPIVLKIKFSESERAFETSVSFHKSTRSLPGNRGKQKESTSFPSTTISFFTNMKKTLAQ